MKLFGALSCILGSALAIFAIVTGFAPKFDPGSWLFTSQLNKHYGNHAKSDQPEVILINEEERTYTLPSCGFGMGCGPDDLRESAEKEFRQKNFQEAARLFEDIVQFNPHDIRSRLGLGKTYVALHNFDDAILFLSTVRNECHRQRYRDNLDTTQFTSTPFEFSNLDDLPEQACEAIDHEARLGLETAVTATIKPKLPESDSVESFKNDRHFQVLNASLQLAKKYHDKSQLEQLKAMYQLAGENTRTLPIELVTACSAHEKALEKRWQELARLSLNGAVEEEKKWYLDRLVIVSEAFPEGDIKNMAVNHILLKDNEDNGDFSTPVTSAQSIKKALNSNPPKYALLFANTAFGYGLRAHNLRYQATEARDLFLLAREVYSKCGAVEDVADTNYNLGITNYRLDRITEAKQCFKLAANIYKGKTRFEQDELKAAFNFGILAVDLTEPGDEEYLTNLYEQTHHPEAAILLGLHYLKNNNFEKAYAPFKHASLANFPAPQRAPTELPEEPNYRRSAPRHQDRTFTDDQVLQAMFVREKTIEESVSSRFASHTISGAECENEESDLLPLTKARYPSFTYAVNALFPTVLMKTNREKELPKFLNQKNCHYRPTAPLNNLGAEEQYLHLLSSTLRKTWFCPPHMLPEQLVVQVQVSKDGTLLISQNDLSLTQLDPVHSSIGESIKWTVLSAPPPGYVGKKLVLVYNASRASGASGVILPRGSSMRLAKESKIEW